MIQFHPNFQITTNIKMARKKINPFVTMEQTKSTEKDKKINQKKSKQKIKKIIQIPQKFEIKATNEIQKEKNKYQFIKVSLEKFSKSLDKYFPSSDLISLRKFSDKIINSIIEIDFKFEEEKLKEKEKICEEFAIKSFNKKIEKLKKNISCISLIEQDIQEFYDNNKKVFIDNLNDCKKNTSENRKFEKNDNIKYKNIFQENIYKVYKEINNKLNGMILDVTNIGMEMNNYQNKISKDFDKVYLDFMGGEESFVIDDVVLDLNKTFF